jgi:hypothetical protein
VNDAVIADTVFGVNDFTPDELRQLRNRDDVRIENMLVVININGVERVVVPYRGRVLAWTWAHITETHLARDATLHRLMTTYWWPHLARDASQCWRACSVCRLSRASKERQYVYTGMASRVLPHHTYSVDFWGPHQRTPRGNVYIFGVRDHGSPLKKYFAT